MSGVLFGLFLLVLFGVRMTQLWRKITYHRQLLRSWQEAAGACRLQVLEASNWSPRLKAHTGYLTVTIDGQLGSKGDGNIRIDVQVPVPPDFHSVRLRRKPLVRGAREIKVGDPRIDGAFFLEGPMRSVLALLDAETRRLLILANAEGRVQIFVGGSLRLEGLSDEQVPSVLPLLLHMGQRLAQPVDIARRLAENAQGDPEPGVRLQNLRLLIRELPEAPETVEALRTACADQNPEIRLQAAKRLGADGRDVLMSLAESLEDDTVSAEAVSALAGELSFERTKAILDRASDRRFPKTSHACLEALGEKGASPGQLSVAEAQGGQLSVVSSEVGRLSLEQAEAGLGALAVEPFPLPPEEEQPSPRAREEQPGRPG